MNDKRLRTVFMGTPEFACSVLQALCELDEIELVGVVSQPDRKVGRKHILTPSPVKYQALEQGISVFQPERIGDLYEELGKLNLDVIVTCAYGQFIPERILQLAAINCLNVHASLLPQLRGGAPIHWAIINNLPKTGVTIMQMIKKMDAGDIYVQAELLIHADETTSSLYKRLADLSYQTVKRSLVDVLKGKVSPIKQDEVNASFGYNITRENERINWNASINQIECLIRGLYAAPIAYTTINNEIIVKIHEATILPQKIDGCITAANGTIVEINKQGVVVKCNDGLLLIKRLQRSGKAVCDARVFYNSNSQEIFISQRFE